MPTVTEMSSMVREALAVSSQYEGTTIPTAIRQVMQRLLRDYNFPKSIRRATLANIGPGTVQYAMPKGVKKVFGVRFYNPTDNTYSKHLERREGITLAPADPAPDDIYGRYYWIEGNTLFIDTPMPIIVGQPLSLVIWHQSTLVDAAQEEWMMDDLQDLIFSRSVVRLAAQLRKPEAMQAFAGLVTDETQSVAIYSNELEWEGVQMVMREPRAMPSPRYPSGA